MCTHIKCACERNADTQKRESKKRVCAARYLATEMGPCQIVCPAESLQMPLTLRPIPLARSVA